MGHMTKECKSKASTIERNMTNHIDENTRPTPPEEYSLQDYIKVK